MSCYLVEAKLSEQKGVPGPQSKVFRVRRCREEVISPAVVIRPISDTKARLNQRLPSGPFTMSRGASSPARDFGDEAIGGDLGDLSS